MCKPSNPTVAPYCKEGEVRLRVTARVESEEEGLAMCDEMIEAHGDYMKMYRGK